MGKNKNFFILLYTLIAIAAVMRQIKYALSSIILSESLKGVELSIFQMKIYGTNRVYTIGHYWLIPIILGLLYNSIIEFRKWKKS
ncbi:hypothetical protein R9X47_24315 [Wukongibacter baidiensis]|uniref:hypothetical protein n=1 Tax=Wukongibacter baidiensis TaxID=1723361 RepID=UPI003D7FF1A2